MATEYVLYVCPNRHRWWTEASESPLANIKCPNCGVTAVRHHRGIPAPRWDVQPLRTLKGEGPRG